MRRSLAVALTTLGAAGVVLGSFLPWLRSGRRGRSSYELYDLLRRLEIGPTGAARGLFLVWPFVPLLACSVVVAAWAGWRTTTGVLAGVTSLVVGAGCVAAWTSSLPSSIGVIVTFLGGLLLSAALVPERAARRPEVDTTVVGSRA